MKHWILASMVALGLSSAQNNISVMGLPAFAEVSGVVTGERFEGRAKVLTVSGNEVRINPWPIYAPRTVKGMNFFSNGFMHPEGPSYRLEFSKPAQKPSFILGIAWLKGREAMPGFAFMPSGQSAVLSSSTQSYTLAVNQLVVIRPEGERWCVRLLGIKFPQPGTPGIANEQSEHRFDWMATRC